MLISVGTHFFVFRRKNQPHEKTFERIFKMKKIVALLLTFVLCFALCACGGPKEVVLTRENIEEYLAFDFNYGDVERQKKIGLTFGYTDLNVKAYAISSGSFENVKITLSIPLNNGWSVSSSDSAYDKNNDETLTLSFNLPATGEYTSTHDLIASVAFSDPKNQNIRYSITEVSGTFIPD